MYRKIPKNLDTGKHCCNHPKVWTKWLYYRVMCPNDADGIANSVDPDQTAPVEAVWSGSAVCPDLPVRKLRITTVTHCNILDSFGKFFFILRGLWMFLLLLHLYYFIVSFKGVFSILFFFFSWKVSSVFLLYFICCKQCKLWSDAALRCCLFVQV